MYEEFDLSSSKDVYIEFDFSYPEDVFIEVIFEGDDEEEEKEKSWKNHVINFFSVMTIPKNGNIVGAASYESIHGSFLDYTIHDLVECPGVGFFVVEGITGEAFKGDGYTTEDDMKFFCKGIRKATDEEINSYM